MKIKVRKAGQITLPKPIRQALQIREGQALFVEIEDGALILRPETRQEEAGFLTEEHPIWQLVGRWASGHRDVSRDKYKHLAEAYEKTQ